MNGIINLKKEAGMTSHDAVFKLRKILGTKKNRSWWYFGPRCGGCLAHCSREGNAIGRIYAG